MAMVASRLFHRARQLYAPKALIPSLPIPKCTNYAYSATKINDLKDTKGKLLKKIDEEAWNIRKYRAAQDAREAGSPFCFTIPVDHVSTDSASSNSDRKNLERYLRYNENIKFDSEIENILRSSAQIFQGSLSADEFQNIIMRHLYILTLQEVIPFEKWYMEHLINEFNHWEFLYQWCNEDYIALLEPYSKLFAMLPPCSLKRGLQLHMSGIPYKYYDKSLGKVLKKEMLRKLEKDYNLLTSKIHDLPSISEAMMVREIKSLVDKRNVGYYKQDAFERRSHIFFERSYQ